MLRIRQGKVGLGRSGSRWLALVGLVAWGACGVAPEYSHADDLPALTRQLTMEGDISEALIAGVDRFLLEETSQSVESRQLYWQRDRRSSSAYRASKWSHRQPLNRQRDCSRVPFGIPIR